jgi:predicted MFS family arabinose efflux permease
MAIRTIFNTMHRMVYPFLAHFSRGLGVEISALSLALTARSAIGAFGPLMASMSDRRGRKAGLILSTILYTSGVALVVIWPTYTAFILALILTTFGKYSFDPVMQAYLGDRVPYQRRGLALAVTEVGWSLSFIVGVPLMGFLIARWGWISPFSLLTILGMVSLGMLIWMLPKDPEQQGEYPSLWQNYRSVFQYRPAVMGLSITFALSAGNEVINLIFGVWMEDAFGLQILALGAASAVIGFAELGGESLVGVLTDRLGKPRAVGIGLILNSLAALSVPVLGSTMIGALVALFLFYITFEFTLVSSIPLMTEIMPESRATLMAANVAGISLGRALGALVATPLYAWGILASAVVTVVFNIFALQALRKLWEESR